MEREKVHLVFGEHRKWAYGTIFDGKARAGDDGANGGGEVDSQVEAARF